MVSHARSLLQIFIINACLLRPPHINLHLIAFLYEMKELHMVCRFLVTVFIGGHRPEMDGGPVSAHEDVVDANALFRTNRLLYSFFKACRVIVFASQMVLGVLRIEAIRSCFPGIISAVPAVKIIENRFLHLLSDLCFNGCRIENRGVHLDKDTTPIPR